MMHIPEITPERFDVEDVAGFKAHLTEHGYACVREAASPAELEHARELLWQHLEGTEPGLDQMKQVRPTGWSRGDPTTWTNGHGDGAMTSTTHCQAMCACAGLAYIARTCSLLDPVALADGL